jgi:hypothetical protein
MKILDNNISAFGFSSEKGGAHTSRTMMLDELRALLSYVAAPEASKLDYVKAIVEDNCLGKRSGKTRILTSRHLIDLYSLNPETTIFRALLYFWQRDIEGQSKLALLCAYARDVILRTCAPFILSFQEGSVIFREALEEHIEKNFPGRFSKATLKSTAQNVNSTFTHAGHIIGKAKKIRSKALPTAGSVSYALFLGYLMGVRGASLFKTEYINLLECSYDKAIELAADASRRGWIVFKRVGDVVEVLFPNLLNSQETEWVREQNQTTSKII